MVVERDKPPKTYWGVIVEKRLTQPPPEIPEATQPDIFGRIDATPRQVEEVILLARRGK